MAVLLALLSAASWGVADFFGGMAEAATDEDRTAAIATWTMVLGLVGVGSLALLGDGSIGGGDALLAAVGGVFGAVGVAALYRGLSVGTISVVAPVTGVVAATLPVLFGVVTGERPGPVVWVGILAALGAIVLVAREEPVDGTRPVNAEALRYAVVSGIGFAAIFIVLGEMPADAGLWPLVPLKAAGIAASVAWMLSSGAARLPHRSTLWPVLAVGVLDNAANVAYLLATREGLLSVVAVLSSLYPAFTVLLARVVLKEHLQRVQLVGMALAGLGVALIAAG